MVTRVVPLRGRFWNVSSVFAHGPSPSIFIRRRHDWTRPMVLVPCLRFRIEDRCGMARCRGYSAIGANAQRPKRFYRNVQVVAVEEERVMETFRKKKDATHANTNDTATLQQLLFPRTPSPQLVPKEENDSKTAITWHTVLLDEKPLRTPSGKPLYIPSLHLAHGMATEWNAVTENIIPQQMPLMTLTCTVLDQVLHAQNQAAADTFRQQCLQYMSTDTVCYYADPKEERPLYQQQNKAWKRLHEWIATSFIQTAATQMAPPAIHICPATTSIYPQKTTTDSTAAAALHLLEQQNPAVDGSSSHSDPDDARAPVAVASPLVRVLPHSPALTKAVEHWIATLDAWHLVALYVACKETKSFWLGVALLLGHATHDSTSPGADTAWVQTAARVEEEWNIRDWGFVEGQHDYDRLNCAIQLRAVAWLVQCMRR